MFTYFFTQRSRALVCVFLGVYLVSGLFAGVANAGEVPFKTPESIGSSLGATPSIDIADMDLRFNYDGTPGDTRPDIIISSAVDELAIWHARYNSALPGDEWIIEPVDPYQSTLYGLGVDDLDGDGDLDVLGGESHGVVWWEQVEDALGFSWTEHNVSDGSAYLLANPLRDVDGDGDLDVLGGLYGEIAWWENTGSFNGVWNKHVVYTAPEGEHMIHKDVFAEDVDGDGDLDLIGVLRSPTDHEITWWENMDGLGVAWDSHSIGTGGNLQIYPADVDGDGDLDCIRLSNNFGEIPGEGLSWLENIDELSWNSHLIDASTVEATIVADDVDGDGRPDVIVQEPGATALTHYNLVWWKNPTGSSTSEWSKSVAVTDVYGATVKLTADMDNDGDLDFVGKGDLLAHTILWKNPNSAGVPWTAHVLDTQLDSGQFMAASDFDEDGDLDLFVSGHKQPNNWFENPVSDTAWLKHRIGFFASPAIVFAADMDKDGDMDILGAGGNGADAGDMTWWERTSFLSWKEHRITRDFAGAADISAADMDGDGDLDILGAASEADAFAWWENLDGLGADMLEHPFPGTFDGASAIRAGDFDGDGDLDIAGTARESGEVIIWENVIGDAMTWNFTVIDTAFSGGTAIRVADFDGDGKLDIVAASDSGNKVAWWRNSGSISGPWNKTSVDMAFAGATAIDVQDMDLDGDLDILGAASGGNESAWWENLAGDGTSWLGHSVLAPLDGASAVAAVDYDVDGDPDVIAAGSAPSSFTLVVNTTIHRSADFSRETIPDPLFRATAQAVTDIDGDGDLDIFASTDFDLVWYENDLGGASWIQHAVDGSFIYTEHLLTGDMDGDGDMDLIGASEWGEVSWWENRNNGATWVRSDLTYVPASPRIAVGDMDGDADLDLIIGFEGAGDDVSWWENSDGLGHIWSSHNLDEINNNRTLQGPVTIVDIDGDGDLDLMTPQVGFPAGTNETNIWENVFGDGLNWKFHSYLSGRANVLPLDYDNDGDMNLLSTGDLLDFWEQERLEYSNGTSQVVWNPVFSVSCRSGASGQQLIDFDGDGDLDVLLTGSRDVYWCENPQSDSVVFWPLTHIGTSDLPINADVGTGDFNNDGKLDVIAANGNLVLWKNGGGQFALPTYDVPSLNGNPGDALDVMEDGSSAVLLIEAHHRGNPHDSDVELTSFELLLDDGAETPLTTEQANLLIDSLSVYEDSAVSGTLVTTVSELSLQSGIQTVSFSDGDANVQLVSPSSNGNQPKVFYVVVELTADAATQQPNPFRVTHVTEASSKAEDRDNDIPLKLEYHPNTSVTVQVLLDTDPPTVLTQDITINLDENGQAIIAALDVDAGSFDNSPIVSRSADPDIFSCADIGENIVTLTVIDARQNSASSTAVVTVVDDNAPVALIKATTVNLDENGQAPLIAADIDAGSYDNCGIALMVARIAVIGESPAGFTCEDLGVIPVEFIIEDSSGNRDAVKVLVGVEDTIPPTMVPPAAIVLTANVDGEAFLPDLTVGLQEEDNCGVATVEQNYPAGTMLRSGETIVTLSAEDTSENATEHDVIVTVTPLDTIAPEAVSVEIRPNPVAVNTPVELTVQSTDADSVVSGVEYSLDEGVSWIAFDDIAVPSASVTVSTALGLFDAPGVWPISVRVFDTGGNVSEVESTFLSVFDPSGGFVTGGGWIWSPAGAYHEDPSLEGKASFGFVSKYKKGAKIPTGVTQFQFRSGNLKFHSDTYNWLVVVGSKAMYKGTGSLNGESGYKFILSAIDGDLTGGAQVDAFRIRIWTETEIGVETVVYDNDLSLDNESEAYTELRGGSIKIHKSK